MSYQLPRLPYDLAALEPTISREIMDLHYNKHHNAYVTNLNKALEEYARAEKEGDLEKMISLQSAIRFNGGGHINHSIFWSILAPSGEGGGGEPSEELGEEIQKEFGSFASFKERFNAKTAGIQGSGWGWLGWCGKSRALQIRTCQNQDPLSITGLTPLLGIDVWEHAYYLDYQNARPKYLEEIWNVVNWSAVSERFKKAKSA